MNTNFTSKTLEMNSEILQLVHLIRRLLIRMRTRNLIRPSHLNFELR